MVSIITYYGTLTTDIVEGIFDDGGSADPESGGTNCTGAYIAEVYLSGDIPELVPIAGRILNCKLFYFEINKSLIN